HGFGTRRFDEADLADLAEANGMRPVLLHQVHSADVLAVDDVLPDKTDGDALMTATAGLLLIIKTADCLPFFLVDAERRAVAAVHAGWRGTAARIAAAAVAALVARFGSDPASLIAALGPCIGPACYEVGGDVAASFGGIEAAAPYLAPIPGRPGRYLLDLPAANRLQLEAAGVEACRIHASGICTHCDPNLLSWRRDRRTDIRIYSFVGIRPSGDHPPARSESR
ncbi:MAG: peptidoglycan editing factor PgeF, partial [Candidatus Aminicenantes bacterium]|nr:peptidoglycan editing factor PgeF [Candidatus Aminicenantes bacterium]